jgi:hypothetical protein
MPKPPAKAAATDVKTDKMETEADRRSDGESEHRCVSRRQKRCESRGHQVITRSPSNQLFGCRKKDRLACLFSLRGAHQQVLEFDSKGSLLFRRSQAPLARERSLGGALAHACGEN